MIKNYLNKFIVEIIIVSVIVFVLLMSVYQFNAISLDRDELFTINMMNMNNLSDIIVQGNINDTHPPLYHTILFFFIRIFGISEFSVKFLSLIFGFFSTIYLYILSKKMFSIKEGIIAVIIINCTQHFSQINQYARGYSLFLFLSILTMLFLYNIILEYKMNKIFTKSIVCYILSAVLCLYTHYYAILLILTEISFLMLFFNKVLYKKILFIFITIFILYLPWIHYISIKNVAVDKPDFINWFKWDVCSGCNIYIFLILCFVPILSMLYNLYKNYKKESLLNYKKELLLVYLGIFPFLVIIILQYFGFECYKNKYLIFSIIPYYIIIARGIVLLFRKSVWIYLFTIVLATSLFLHLCEFKINNNANIASPKQAFLFVKNKFNKYDNSCLIIGFGKFSFEYYIDKYNNEVIPDNKIIFTSGDVKTAENIINNSNLSYIWLIDSKEKDEYSIFKLRYELIDNVSFDDGKEWSCSLFKVK